MPHSIKKDDIKKPGSLLRWLFVQTNDEIEQKRVFDKYLGRFKNYYSASLGKDFFTINPIWNPYLHRFWPIKPVFFSLFVFINTISLLKKIGIQDSILILTVFP